MKTKITLSIVFLIFYSALLGQTTIPGGDVYGNWTVMGSPYLIEGDISVPADCTLIIDPGVNVEFQGAFKFNILGLINCQGTESDSILFSAATSAGHRGLGIGTDTNVMDSIIFTYCRFQQGRCSGEWPTNCGGGIGVLFFDRLRVEHCLFIDNDAMVDAQAGGGAIAMNQSDGIFRHNTFIDNKSRYGGAIIVYYHSDPLIANNYFYDNHGSLEGGAIIYNRSGGGVCSNNEFIANTAVSGGGAISFYDNSSPQISHNLFSENSTSSRGGAVYMKVSCNPLFLNNTFVNNNANLSGGAIADFDQSCPRLVNNIFWGNNALIGSQYFISDSMCQPGFFNNDMEFGKAGVEGFHNLCDWKGNIVEYPEFEDTTAGIFHLSWISPCLDAGVDSIIDPDGTISDQGAYYFDQTGIGVDNLEERNINLTIYPNPANNRIQITTDGDQVIEEVLIYNQVGQLMYRQSWKGSSLDVSDLATGIYILEARLEDGLVREKFVKR